MRNSIQWDNSFSAHFRNGNVILQEGWYVACILGPLRKLNAFFLIYLFPQMSSKEDSSPQRPGRENSYFLPVKNLCKTLSWDWDLKSKASDQEPNALAPVSRARVQLRNSLSGTWEIWQWVLSHVTLSSKWPGKDQGSKLPGVLVRVFQQGINRDGLWRDVL